MNKIVMRHTERHKEQAYDAFEQRRQVPYRRVLAIRDNDVQLVLMGQRVIEVGCDG